MPKVAKKLSAIEVQRLSKVPGLHAVGTVAGLRLSVSDSGGAVSWILRTMVGTKRKEIGLGGYPAVTLAGAIEQARGAIQAIKAGTDPVAARRTNRSEVGWTFKTCATEYMNMHRPKWKNAKHAQQWESTLETYVYPKMGDKHVKDVSTEDVLAVIAEDWPTKNETMSRIRGRIELVISWAQANGHRPRDPNPAAWRGHLERILPRPSDVNGRKSFEAMPIDQMHGFMVRLRDVAGMSARCLEFAILTACRSGEARGALWSEIDLDAGVWAIPAERMKAKRPHRVPLGSVAVELLSGLPRFEGTDLVFPGREVTKPLSDMSLTATMRRMNLDAVPHGFRSTFTDWCAERTSYPSEVREMALAHAVGDKTEAAYRRGDLFERRRALMDDWASFIGTAPAPKNVVRLKAA